MTSQVRVILIEGLPGSGKTSLAEWLCAQTRSHGVAASWIPELQRDHPVIDRPTMRTAKTPGYADRCIARWEAFAGRLQACADLDVAILEGCLFQSTVRFLVEYERSDHEIRAYLPAVERCLAPLCPHLIYLTQTDVASYLQGEVVRRKGEEIVSRIATYSATTPFSVSRGLREKAAFVSLYSSYRRVCDGLVRSSRLPVLEVDTVRNGEVAIRGEVGSWIAAALAR
jgi:molybdopterin-guanine dinucleotide biosynthesis protein